MDNNYTQITWPEVRKGDVLMHENGDRLTVESATYANLTGGTFRVTVATRGFGTEELERIGFTPYRRKPEVPSVPGAYADKDGEFWLLRGDEGGIFSTPWFSARTEVWVSRTRAAHFAPFTRLVPMPTEEQVREAADSGLADRSEFAATAVTNAVMALLEAGQNGEGEQ